MTRRRFLQHAAAGSAALVFADIGLGATRKLSPNDKLNLGIIGVAHQGQYDLNNVATENIVALCDVDATSLARAAKRFPAARCYSDFRRLLEQKDIDAVVIATPDHTHAVATVTALRSGRDVYCEKPLTHTISECRIVMETARKTRRVTQIGTQIHAGSNYRRVVELVQGGVIGSVTDVHVWVDAVYGQKAHPEPTATIPAGLNYNLWLGPVPFRPYSSDYLPQHWRNWWHFGGGALADFGCHYIDLPHWALDLREPVSAEAVSGPPVSSEAVPPWLIVRYQHPARGQQPQVTLTWYQGGRKPRADVLGPELAQEWPSGVLFLGTKGNLLADYHRRRLLPDKTFADFVPPPPSIPESLGHHAEWVRACKSGGPTTCNFDYSGALTIAALLGNVAYRVGQPIHWDGPKLRAAGCPQAQAFIRHEYRPGWRI